MEILGYSERGVINTFLYELYYFSQNQNLNINQNLNLNQNLNPNLNLNLNINLNRNSSENLSLLNEFLKMIHFPYNSSGKLFNIISDAKILIEQSFSDFGDSDFLLLIENNGKRETVFFEAKVKTCQKSWCIKEQVSELEDIINNKKEDEHGNLFVQLIRKVRLVEGLKKHGFEKFKKEYIKVFNWSTKAMNIGDNPVVLEAVKKLKDYDCNTYFVAIVPDNVKNVENVYITKLKKLLSNCGINDCYLNNWGFITWEEIEEFCKHYNLVNTLKVFQFNNGQIYEKDSHRC